MDIDDRSQPRWSARQTTTDGRGRMRNSVVTLLTGIMVVVLAAPEAHAQVFTPTYLSPVPLSDVGVYLSDSPGDLTVEGIWRGGPLGLRVGYVDAELDDLLSLGAELRSPVGPPGDALGLAFTAGAQGLIGDADAVGLQVGLSAGHRFVHPGLALTPYIHPRVGFINGFGAGDDFEVDLLADVGIDVEIPRSLVFRVGIGLSDNTANWGLGLAWRRR